MLTPAERKDLEELKREMECAQLEQYNESVFSKRKKSLWELFIDFIRCDRIL